MNPEKFQRAWQSQTAQAPLTIDAVLLFNEVRRNAQYFKSMVFWRDFREVGVSLLLVPIWIYLGQTTSAPWTWYLTIPALLWVAGFMLVDRARQKRRSPGHDDSLREHLESSLAQIDHQIWLLKNVFWWYLLPIALSVVPLFVEHVWELRAGGWLTLLAATGFVVVGALTLLSVYRLNQHAVRTFLVPRKNELNALLSSLEDERSQRN